MTAKVTKIDSVAPEPEILKHGCDLLLAGEVVAFPTETVYGLGANALNPQAVKKIYEAKGRPSQNPLIVHVADWDALIPLVRSISHESKKLAETFWPGPMTLIFPKSQLVPDIVTGGGDTVAIRMPSHPVALALLKQCGLPLAAPSANRSNALSPTTAQHVLESLGDRIPLILDGGPTQQGIESTVVDVSATPPKILRYGALPVSEIEKQVGPCERPSRVGSSTLPSPGMLAKHYSPITQLECVEGNLSELLARYAQQGLRVGVLTFGTDVPNGFNLGNNPQEAGRKLYEVLHELDRQKFDRIVAELPPHQDEWLAIRDRLLRASA